MLSKRNLLFLFLFFISGTCGLIYEVVWSRLLVFVFGATTFAVTTVLTCFMGGLALGSYLANRYENKVKRPFQFYGFLEICIGIFCILIPFLFEFAIPIYKLVIELLGDSLPVLTTTRVFVSAVILIFPTTCMGATLPILAKGFVKKSEDIGGHVARLYGFNTMGAVVGCMGAGFFLLPMIGLQGSILVAGFLNIIAGITAIVYSSIQKILVSDIIEKKNGRTRKSEQIKPITHISPVLVLILYGLSGFVAMTLQVAWSRTLILSLGSSTYAFTMIVSSFIMGLAIGSFVISFWINKIKNPLAIAGLLQAAIALSALLIVPLFGEMTEVVRKLLDTRVSFENILLSEFFYVFALLIFPTACMGALLPLMCRLYDSRFLSASKSVGRVYASNTVGTIAGAIVAGFILIPSKYVGMQSTVIFVSLLSGIVATVLISYEKGINRVATLSLIGSLWFVGIVLGNTTKSWSQKLMVSGPFLASSEEEFNVLYYREGIDATVAVTSPVRSHGTMRALRINGKPDASNEWGDMITQNLLGSIPMLLKPESKEICNIGLGSGVTVGAVLAFPVERVDVVEISSAVVEAANYFADSNNYALGDPRTNVHLSDGRNFLLLTDHQYDLIISEPSNPWMSGIANLYTKEFFEIALEKLKPGGMHCQWIHSYSIKAEDFAAILKTFYEVFPYVQLWELMSTDFLVIGSDQEIPIDVESLYHSFAQPSVIKSLSPLNINDPLQLANYYVADQQQLSSWINNQRILRDDIPYLEFSAPRYLLKNEHHQIIKEICNFDGLPKTTSRVTNSVLNAKFLEEIGKSTKRRKYFYDAKISASKRDLKVTFDNFARAAMNGSTDARAAMILAQELAAYRSVLPRKYQNLVAETELKIAKSIPGFKQFQNLVYGNPASLIWPFSRDIKRNQSEKMKEMFNSAKKFDKASEKQIALIKAKERIKINPYHQPALQFIGRLLIDLDDEEQAIDYLLQALVLSPSDREVNYHLARAYSARGDQNKSLNFLEVAISNGFDEITRIKSDSRFAILQNVERYTLLLNSIKS